MLFGVPQGVGNHLPGNIRSSVRLVSEDCVVISGLPDALYSPYLYSYSVSGLVAQSSPM